MLVVGAFKDNIRIAPLLHLLTFSSFCHSQCLKVPHCVLYQANHRQLCSNGAFQMYWGCHSHNPQPSGYQIKES